MSDWFFDNLGWFLFGGIILIFGLIFLAAAGDAEKERRFMQQCVTDHKEYECEAMWRAGENRNTYIPVVIPIR